MKKKFCTRQVRPSGAMNCDYRPLLVVSCDCIFEDWIAVKMLQLSRKKNSICADQLFGEVAVFYQLKYFILSGRVNSCKHSFGKI